MNPAVVEMINKSEYPFSKLLESVNYAMPPITPADLSNKVIIVTGANTGIGYEIAKSLASMKPQKLILACRNQQKGEDAVKSIKEATQYEAECWLLDLASFESVQQFSKKFLDTGLPLDILVSNAGLGASKEWVETDDGHEIVIQVNHLANVLLVSNLYPALKKSADAKKDLEHNFPRVVVVASDVHYWSFNPQPTDPNPVSAVLKKSENVQYFTSKLFNVLFVQAFARKCPAPIWICATNPSYTESELGQKNPKTGEAVDHGHFDFKKRTTYDGAKTIIHAAITPTVAESGSYYSEMQPSPTRSYTTGETGKTFADNVWRESIEILKKHVPSSPAYDW